MRLLRETAGLKSWRGADGERDVLVKDLDSARVLGRPLAAWNADQAAIRRPVLPGVVPFEPLRGVGRGVRLVRPWVLGRSLQELFADGSLDRAAALEAGLGVLRALRTLHGRGVLHRNLRPGNVILGPRGPVLVDLGLTPVLDPAGPDALRAPSRIRYLSPEQTGALIHEVDERTDLHAVGLMLWEALTGEPLQRGPELGGLIRSQLAATGPALPGHPVALEGMLRRLVHPDPRERYQSAEAALRDLEELVQSLAAGEDDPTIELGAADLRSSLAEPVLVGRKPLMAKLQRALDELPRGRGGLVALDGRPGSGRSRVLEELARRAEAQGVAVLSVRGAAGPRELPLLDALGGRLDEIGARLRRLADARTLLLVDDAEGLSPEEGQVLASLGERPVHGLLVVLAFNTDELGEGDPLRGLPAGSVIRLRRLGRRALRQLLRSMGGQLPDGLVERIAGEADGSPWMAVELLRGAVEEGALSPGPSGWRLSGTSELQPSRRAALLVGRRVARLSTLTRDFLGAVAVLGGVVDPALAGSLVELDEDEVRIAVAEALAAQVVRVDGGVRLVHASLREALLDGLDDVERTRLHLAAGELLEARRPDDVLALARHFERAGEPRRALGYAMAAGRRAAERGALVLAETWFAQVLAQTHLLDPADELEAHMALAGIAVHRGRLNAARDRLHAVGSLLADPVARQQNELRLADVDLLAGDRDEADRRLRALVRGAHADVVREEALERLVVVAFIRGDRARLLRLHLQRLGQALRGGPEVRRRVRLEQALLCASLGFTGRARRLVQGLGAQPESRLAQAAIDLYEGRLEEVEAGLATLDRATVPWWALPLSGVLEGMTAAFRGHLAEATRRTRSLAQPVAADLVRMALGESPDRELGAPLSKTVLGRMHALCARLDRLEALTVWVPDERARELREARRELRRLGQPPPVLAPRAAVLEARVLALRGKHERAKAVLDGALVVAEEQDARLSRLEVLEVRGRLGEALGWPEAAADVALARAARRALEGRTEPPAARPTLSLVERFEGVLAAGHRLASELDRTQLREALVEEAARLLRPECCALVGVEPPYGLLAGDRQALVGAGLVRAALDDERAVLASEDGSSSFGDSVVMAGARSALAVAIRAEGRPVAVLVAAHRRLDGIFHDEERRLAGYLATLAGAAVENGQRFAQLQELRESLEERVVERGQQLEEAQQQLIHAAKMAAVGTLVAGLSHELNNPMSVILGWSQVLLARTGEDDPRRRALHNIEREARRCAGLVQSLLDFSRKTPGERTRLDLAALVASVADIASGPARRRGVELKVAVGSLPPLDGCAAELESTLLNLVTNAIDATPPGGTVHLGGEAEGAGVRLRVVDSGEGVPPELRERIFEPFFTTKAVGKGTGLGLALAQRFVEAHGGTLRCESQLGAGTTMSLWLPRTSVSEVA